MRHITKQGAPTFFLNAIDLVIRTIDSSVRKRLEASADFSVAYFEASERPKAKLNGGAFVVRGFVGCCVEAVHGRSSVRACVVPPVCFPET